MRWKRDQSIVPVVMFHSVGIQNVPWIWSALSESLTTFEQVLVKLVEKGFQTVGLADLHDHMSGQRLLPNNCIVLTFDDGYLDNWVNAVPLLRKYGLRATVYVTPEFVDRCSEPRSNTAVAGFMNWDELRAADSEGILDVQCHALTHTWYFAGPSVVDIHRPLAISPYPWLFWNARPDRKPYYIVENQQKYVPWGQPVFEHEKSLIVRQFTPQTTEVKKIHEFVATQGGAEFFERHAWRAELTSRFPVLGDAGEFPGSIESDDDYRERVFHELTTSRQILERELRKAVEFLSWPGGGVNQTALELAKQAGFKSWTLSSWQKPNYRNQPGANAEEIKRVSGRSNVLWRNRQLNVGKPASWVVLKVLRHQGSLVSRIVGAIKKLAWIASSYLSAHPDSAKAKYVKH